MLTQGDLIKYMRHFGYPSHDNGVCMAVALMGMQAILAQDLPTFLQRLEIIEQDIRSDYGLSPQQHLDHNILSFLEGLEFHLQPFDYPEYFKPGQAPRTPHPLKSMGVVESQAIRLQGGIFEAAMFTGVYNQSKLINYFKSFKKTYSELDYQHPLSLLLRNIDHAITISFDKEKKQWIVIDANHFPIQYFNKVSKLVNFILRQFGNEDNKDVIFGTHLLTTKMHQDRVQAFVEKWQARKSWKAAHRHTKAQASAQDSWGATWLRIAVKQGDVKSVDKLLNMGIDPNQRSKEVLPLKFAALYGRKEIVKKLLANGANPRMRDHGESTLEFARSTKLLNMYKLMRHHQKRSSSHKLKRLQQENARPSLQEAYPKFTIYN